MLWSARPRFRLVAGSITASACLLLALSCTRSTEPDAADILAAGRNEAACTGVTISEPLDETIFPPELPPPTFRWQDATPGCDTWLVSFSFADRGDRLNVLTSTREWTPSTAQWDEIKRRSRDQDATLAILGISRAVPRTILSGGRIHIRTSSDEVGAPLFYREVNLPFAEAVKDPSQIRWRFGPISATAPPPVVLENLPVCGNCHSFSADGAMLGMDVDYANDKASYALTPVRRELTLGTTDIITWNDFRKEDGQATFGLLSQVSPDGRYAVSTVKDRSVFVATPDRAFSQLFFPIRGILAVYDRDTRTFAHLPGADDPNFVQSNPSWSPDGQHIVFARSRAHRLPRESNSVLLTAEECAEFLQQGKTFLFDLYRIPFNAGAGGTPEPLAGASHNGMSNYFARYSPDGRWIVFCQARSFMLLQPDSALYIIPAAGGEARRLRCNTGRMNSWHTWSPNGKWLVFSSKANSDFTQLFITHIDEHGESSPPVCLSRLTAPDRAANIPEFVNTAPTALAAIRPAFIDDVSYVRAGDAFLRGNDVPGALRQFRKALELNPQNAIAHSNLGGVLVTQGTLDEGVRHLQEAIRLDPTNGGPHYNLGMLLARQGQTAAAVTHLKTAVRYRPEVADAHRVLGALLCNVGDTRGGADELAEAVRLDPNDHVAQYCLGKALAALDQPADAVQHLARAVQLRPDYVTALQLLGQLQFRAGRVAEAVAALSRALQLQPDDPGLLSDLAWALATTEDPAVRNPTEAVDLARRACQLTGHQAFAALDILGVSLAAAGRFEDAAQAAADALRLARAAGQSHVAAGIDERLALYRQRRPFRLPPTSPPASAPVAAPGSTSPPTTGPASAPTTAPAAH